MRANFLLLFALTLVLACAVPASLVRAQEHAVVTYAAGTPESAATVVARYASIPKGVVLEGVAEGFDPLTSVTYDKDANVFTLNGNMKYRNPVSKREFAQILKALRQDDRMGVTLKEGEPFMYGPLSADSDIARQMIETDKLLGGIVYGIERLLEGVKLPGGYKPVRAGNRQIPVVAFSRFTNYVFEKAGENYQRSSCNIDVQLIPLAEQKTATGGHLPDTEKAKEYVMEEADRANLEHLRTHQAEYLQIPAFAKTAVAGEAAAFARLVRDSRIDVDRLLKQF